MPRRSENDSRKGGSPAGNGDSGSEWKPLEGLSDRAVDEDFGKEHGVEDGAGRIKKKTQRSPSWFERQTRAKAT